MNTRIKKALGTLRSQPRKIISILLPLGLFIAGWWFGLPAAKVEEEVATNGSGQIWTCSMDPQIRQPNPGDCPICGMDLIILQDSGDGAIREVAVSSEAAALLNLQVSPVVRAAAVAEVSLFGRIEYDERRMSTITSRIGGRIDRLFVDFTGALVREGDHLAEIYSPEIYVAQREVIEATKAIANQPAGSSEPVRQTRARLLNAAREKLRLLQLSEEQIDDIAARKDPSDHITIRSPQDGIVVDKSVNLGSYVKTGEPLFKVADLSQVWLILEAYESDLQWLRYAQDVAFQIEAISGEEFHGRVAFIDPDINPVTRVAKVRVNVANPDRKLKPGMFARAEVKSRMTTGGKVVDPALEGKWISPMHPEIMKDGPGTCDICGMPLVPASELGFLSDTSHGESLPLLVPASAILHTGERAVVYVQLPEKTEPVFEGREILLGAKVGRQFIVENGLSEGELVVSQGAFKLDSELQIKAKPSMMNPNAGLVEVPANSAPKELAGQWDPVLRSLARLQKASDPESAEEAIAAMIHGIDAVDHSDFQPDTMKLWREFSNRLLNDLKIARRELPESVEGAARIASRSAKEAGRYLGLSSQTESPPQVDEALANSIENVIKAYLPLSKALADDDPEKAKTAALEFSKVGGKIPLADDARYFEEKALELGRTGEIEKQREIFFDISNKLISLVRSHGLDQVGSAYVVHCPMANGGDGADWISNVPQVINPYFGDTMLNCGSVTATLSLGKQSNQMENHEHGK